MKNTARQAFYLASALSVTALSSLAATGGKLAVTQAINSMAAEFSGPLAYSICLGGVALTGLDAVWHRELGAIGKVGLGVAFGSGIAMGAPTILSMIPGASGMVV